MKHVISVGKTDHDHGGSIKNNSLTYFSQFNLF